MGNPAFRRQRVRSQSTKSQNTADDSQEPDSVGVDNNHDQIEAQSDEQ